MVKIMLLILVLFSGCATTLEVSKYCMPGNITYTKQYIKNSYNVDSVVIVKETDSTYIFRLEKKR